MCTALEAVERGDIDRLIIEAPPRHTKSELASRRFPAWFLGRHPNEQIITATYNAEMAADFGRDVRNIVDSTLCRNIFPQLSLRPDSRAANRWHTTQGGIYVAAGVGSALTGRGGHLAIIDDPFKGRAEADSEAHRAAVWDWYRAVFLTRLMPGGRIILVATRWAEDDLTGRILQTAEKTGEKWHRISLPAIDEDGKALWPKWYPLKALEKLKATLGPRDWLSLYQQRPTAFEGIFFQREWMRYYEQAPEGLSTYISADFAVSESSGDFTEIGVWGVDETGAVYLLDWWYGQETADVWIEQILDRVDRFEPLALISETGQIRRAVEPFLARAMRDSNRYVMREWLPHAANKSAHARSFQAIMANGRVHFPETDWAERVLNQLLKFPSGRRDDAVDVCSLFARYIHRTWGQKAHEPTKPKTLGESKGVLIKDILKDCYGGDDRSIDAW